ncbi:MAG TPA: alkaline phosphatase family protein, partial [Flavitalea sp.]|nr:alkaline phosphatase family protein [Flavitalea sp.]
MDSRREFLKKAALLTGGTGLFNGLPASIQQALAIDPLAGTTYLDAEHIVVLMQENRSFDHCYGSLRGVRGFNDRRVITMPDSDPVWFQKNEKGQAYAPFRLNIKETKSTWTGSLPHSWTNQVDARNNGKYDKWLIAKPSGNKDFAQAPLTMGYYNREDIPFYYSLADAFTVCDQNFCSSLTGTTPNRLFLWTGTIRTEQHQNVRANVLNSDVDYDAEDHWTTFPERLEDNSISWKIYQNEISIASGLSAEEDAWLTNFTDNPIEWFSQFGVRFSDSHRRYLRKVLQEFPSQINQLEKQIAGLNQNDKQFVPLTKELAAKKNLLQKAKSVTGAYTDEAYAKLSEREKNLHTKAFTTNKEDPQYRTIEPYSYTDGGKERTMNLPKGDVLHQFRKDVLEGKLPTVSWVVGPENFSDHPGAPWYGAWYVSEVMDILTQNPEVWKKTIFILCYDENDGYFDHVPPFVPPDPYRKGTGLVSKGIDARVDYVKLEQDMKGKLASESRE